MHDDRISALAESVGAIIHIREKDQNKRRDRYLTECSEKDDFYEKLNKYRNHKEIENDKKLELKKEAFDGCFGLALKDIYIGSLGNVSERAQIIACENVDRYIEEQGGARAIINKNRGKTQFLDTLFNIVEETYNENIDTVLKEAEEEALAAQQAEEEKDDEEVGEFKASEDQAPSNEEKEEGSESAIVDAMKDLTNKIDEFIKAKQNKLEGEEPESEEPSEENDNIDFESAEDDEEVENTDSDSVLEDEKQDEDVDKDDVKDLLDDTRDESLGDGDKPTPETDNSNDSVEDKSVEELEGEIKSEKELPQDKEDLFKKMEKEDNITAAVDLLGQRIKDAEEDFIKKNAIDKKKIENIVNNLNDRINGATDGEMGTSEKEEAQNEATRLITEVRENRIHSVFEEMVKSIAENIVQDQSIIESYKDDNGKLDMGAIVETAKTMYGFVEFLNTTQLEKVDEGFIKNILDNK